jgi:hypothetical protein
MIGNLAFPFPQLSEYSFVIHLRVYILLCAEDIDAFERVRECANKDAPEEITAFVNAQTQYRVCRHLVHRAALNLYISLSGCWETRTSVQYILRDYLHGFLQFYSLGEYPRAALMSARSYPVSSELESALSARQYSTQLRLLVPLLRQQEDEHMSLFADMLESEEHFFAGKRALAAVDADDQWQQSKLTEELGAAQENMLSARRVFIDYSRRVQSEEERAALRDLFSICGTLGI